MYSSKDVNQLGWYEETPAPCLELLSKCNATKDMAILDVGTGASTFIDCLIEEGQTDMFEVMKAYKEVGSDGPMIVDHTPHIVDDTDWGHRGRAYAMGYIKALIGTVNAVSGSSEGY